MILAAGEPGRDPKWGSRWLSQVQREPPSDPKVAAWLEKVEPALAILREAARRPNCVYEDLGKATIASTPPQPYEENLTTPLIVSAAAKLDRGDLDGSWEEVETLLRMARQYSTVRTWSYSPIETQAVAQAFRWAADSRQTADSLERALAAYRSLPPGDTPADRVRVERIVFQNTLDLPPGDLVDIALRLVHGQSRKVSTIDALQARAMTTPWEIARARKVFDLMAASWIETLRAESGSGARPRMARLDSRFALPRGVTIQYADGSSRRVEPLELLELSSFTPLVQRALLAGTAVNRGGEPFLSILTDRRALAMVLRLRLHQARHDGALPESLDELPPPGGAVGGVDLEAMDPFGQGRFGYLPSTGQRLVPLEDAAYQGWFFQQGNPSPRVPTDGSRLLYSVGPDRVDGRAADNLDLMQRGDVVFPLKDGVKPPPAGSS
jgi:hypothetical protein